MTDIEAKYNNIRPSIKHGDIILVRGRSPLTRIIEWADNAYYSHALVVFKMGERLLAIQSMADGVGPMFLSTEVMKNVDFCIIRPKVQWPQWSIEYTVNECVNSVFSRAEAGIPYDYAELVKILLHEKLGLKIKNIQGNPRQNICSVFAGNTYGSLYPITCYVKAFNKKGYLTPQDLIRFADPSEVKIIANYPK